MTTGSTVEFEPDDDPAAVELLPEAIATIASVAEADLRAELTPKKPNRLKQPSAAFRAVVAPLVRLLAIDFFFEHLLDHYLDNPDSVAEQAGVEIATSRRSAEQLMAERDARRHFQTTYAELRAVPVLEVEDEGIKLAQRVRDG